MTDDRMAHSDTAIAAAEPFERRTWLLPALLLLLVLAPLLRSGLPANEVGALALSPTLATQLPLPTLYVWLLGGSEIVYKLLLMLALLLTGGAVAWAAGRWWGDESAWWLTALWLTSPLSATVLYLQGWPHQMLGLAFLAMALGLIAPFGARTRFLAALPPLVAGLLLLTDGNLVSAPAWLLRLPATEAPVAALPIVPLVLAAAALLIAPRPPRLFSKVRTLLLLAAVGAGVALWFSAGGGMALATLSLVLGAGALPRLDPRFGASPVVVAFVALAALTLYPALQPKWWDAPPVAHAGTSALFGEAQVALLDVQRIDQGTAVETTWQLVRPIATDQTVFVHLLDEAGEIVAQQDQPLVDGLALPLSGWRVGQIVTQRFDIEPVEGATALRIGLYDPTTLERMPLVAGDDNLTIVLP